MFSDTERTDLSYSEEKAEKIIWLPSSSNLSSEEIVIITNNLQLT